ncbi:MAG TPA: hypothetical protein VKY57_07705 [Chitinispirillaceae bacterium]|nr:hypothetical protein [Chitinispirillaceae bacterium]
MIAVAGIRKKAKVLGIAGSKMKKDDLIIAIQKAEGNFPCFKTANGSCDQIDCMWREECLDIKKS